MIEGNVMIVCCAYVYALHACMQSLSHDQLIKIGMYLIYFSYILQSDHIELVMFDPTCAQEA